MFMLISRQQLQKKKKKKCFVIVVKASIKYLKTVPIVEIRTWEIK
jgi:hypothetical protein